jgi:putative ABC transport system permease protein
MRGASLVRALARVLLRLYPASFRARHGAAYVDTAVHIWRRECERSAAPWAILRVFRRLSVDTLLAAPRAHRFERGQRATDHRGGGGAFFSWLDFKLGLRMLGRYPGLTVVGGLAIAFAIWVGVGTFELTKQWISPDLKLPAADRLVGIDLWDRVERQTDYGMLYELALWRDELESVEELSAFRMTDRNLVSELATSGAPVNVAEVTASSFRATRVPARFGRFLTDEDERPGAPGVVVIGHALWQERFGGANVIGQEVRLDDVPATIVGIMPAGYAFPVHHEAWVPLRVDAALEPGGGPAIRVFGRLTGSATLDDARTELSYLGSRVATAHPGPRAQVQPRVLPYARSIVTLSPGDFAGLRWVNVAVLLLLALACGNVALLIFARAATRESEIVVRTALGASRGRIIAQLFVEALVLGTVGALLGIVAARYGMRFAIAMMDANMGPLPFWVNAELSAPTLFYAAVLTILAALLAGVVPALRITRAIGTRLRQAGPGGGGLKFSGAWTVVIIAQIALSVTGPVTALLIWRATAPLTSYEVGFPEREYLSAGIRLEDEDVSGAPLDTAPEAFAERYARTLEELDVLLSSDPAIAGVTFATRVPRNYHPSERIELREHAVTSQDSAIRYYAKLISVAVDYFELLGAEIRTGRGFGASDAAGDQNVVVVNESFVTEILRGRNPIGRQIRHVTWNAKPDERQPEAWYEIVGVVSDVGTYHEGTQAALYFPLQGTNYPAHAIIRVHGEPMAQLTNVRRIANTAEPTLRLHELAPMTAIARGFERFQATLVRIALFVSAVSLLLSLAGIYSVMSFAVSRRTREIGVRVALGADARRVTLAIFRRPLLQLGTGVLIGALLVTTLVRRLIGELSAGEAAALVGYVGVMTAICMLACVVPTRRALAVEPTEALRADD